MKRIATFVFTALLTTAFTSAQASSEPPLNDQGPAQVRYPATSLLSAIQAVPSGSVVFQRDLSLNGDNGPYSDFGQQIADSFSLSAAASVTGATWYGNFHTQGDPVDVGDTWDFTVRIYEDTGGGLPSDTPLAEANVTATVEEESGLQEGDTIYLFSAEFTPVELSASVTYYFVVLSSTNNSFRWNNGTPQDGDLILRNADDDAWLSVGGGERDSSAFALYSGDVEIGTARFQVTKTFSNGDTGDVEVTLNCNGGIPLQQSFTISGGGPGVTFTVTNLPDTGANCAVTETGGNEGYMAEMNGGAGCEWTGVTSGLQTCAIENVPEATTVSVDTTVDTDGDATIDPTFTTTIVCQNVSPDTGPNFGTVTVTNTDGMFEADWYADPVNGTDCTVTMVPNASAVEGDSCSFSFDIGDEEAGCDVAGTVFFEGIPTLSQYGLVIMALLMLGIGFVGMRRFV